MHLIAFQIRSIIHGILFRNERKNGSETSHPDEGIRQNEEIEDSPIKMALSRGAKQDSTKNTYCIITNFLRVVRASCPLQRALSSPSASAINRGWPGAYTTCAMPAVAMNVCNMASHAGSGQETNLPTTVVRNSWRVLPLGIRFSFIVCCTRDG